MKNILVAGGCGFIGKNMVKHLTINEPHSTLYVIDNYSTGQRDSHDILRLPNVIYIEGDITDDKALSSISKIKIDQIYNFACPASPLYYLEHPIETTKASVFGIINLLDLAKRNQARLLQSSTSEVYGDSKLSPQNETQWGNVNPTGPRACYDEGKRCAESLIFDYIRLYAMDIRVARIFNTYGPGMSPTDGRIVSNFICQCLHNKDITIYGTGAQTRSLCYIDDTICGLYLLMNSPQRIPFPINIGNPDEKSVLGLAVMIKRLMGSSAKIRYLAKMIDDPQKRCPDIKLALDILQWYPKTSLEEGLIKTIDYYRRIV